MMTIFDEEYILKTYVASKQKEAADEAAEKAKKEALMTAEREALMKAKLSAQKMYDKGSSVADIAEILDVSQELVEQWLNLSMV